MSSLGDPRCLLILVVGAALVALVAHWATLAKRAKPAEDLQRTERLVEVGFCVVPLDSYVVFLLARDAWTVGPIRC